MPEQKINTIKGIIMFADIKNSTEFAFTSPSSYHRLIEEFQNTAKKTISNYISSQSIDKDKILAYGQGDEVAIIIYDIDMELATKYAIELSIHLKLMWRTNDYIREKREAYIKIAEGKVPIDLRIGIGYGELVKFISPWNNSETFSGVAINVAKRIEASAEYAEDTLIMVSDDVKNYYERQYLNIKFGKPHKLSELQSKGVSEHFSPWVYPIMEYPDSIKISEVIIMEKKTYLDYFDSGYAKRTAGDYDGAIEDFSKAIELNPKYANAYYYRARIYNRKSLYEEVLKDINKAIELDLSGDCGSGIKGAAYTLRGCAYYGLEQYDEAIDAYNKAIEINPKNLDSYNQRASAYYEKGLFDKIIEDCNKVIELGLSGESAWGIKIEKYLHRGMAYFQLGEFDKAIEDCNKAIELNPDSADAYNGRGITYHWKGLYDKALEDYNKALELDPKNAQVYSNFGWTYYFKGLYEKAIEYYTKAIELDPSGDCGWGRKGFIYTNRSNAYFYLNKYDSAIEDCKKAVEINNEFDIAYADLGLIYYKIGNKEEALENYKKAIEANKNFEEKFYYLKDKGFSLPEHHMRDYEEYLKEMKSKK